MVLLLYQLSLTLLTDAPDLLHLESFFFREQRYISLNGTYILVQISLSLNDKHSDKAIPVYGPAVEFHPT